jgi:hypothetical protein
MDMGGVEEAMGEQCGIPPVQIERQNGWFNWAERHSGVLLLGALMMAILALPKSPGTADIERDPSGEEVPLFI